MDTNRRLHCESAGREGEYGIVWVDNAVLVNVMFWHYPVLVLRVGYALMRNYMTAWRHEVILHEGCFQAMNDRVPVPGEGETWILCMWIFSKILIYFVLHIT